MTQDTEDRIEKALLQGDVALLDELNVSDDTMAQLAGEHACRCAALCKAIDPSFGRALLLTIASTLLQGAQLIDANSFQEPELVELP